MMKSYVILVSVVLTCGFLTGCGGGAKVASEQFEVAVLSSVIEDELAAQNVLGGAVAVVRNGRIIHSQGYGYTSLQKDVPVTSDTVFRWASISKTLTAVAALKLDEADNDFSIEDRVPDHFDGWPSGTSDKGEITIKQLLSNRSGVTHYQTTNSCPDNPAPEFDRTVHGDIPFNAANAVDVFDDQALCFTPGADFKYSTFGFTLAAAAMERQANTSYSQWVQENIATPLQMDSLTQGTGESSGFVKYCGELQGITEGSKSYVLPGGGWASNITDLAKFANGIVQGALLSDTERLWQEDTGNSNSYRLGISLSADSERAWHAGTHADLQTFMHLYHAHEDKVAVVVYLNNADSNAERVAKRVANSLNVANWSDLGEVPAGGCDIG